MAWVVAIRPASVAAFHRHRPEDPSAQLPVTTFRRLPKQPVGPREVTVVEPRNAGRVPVWALVVAEETWIIGMRVAAVAIQFLC
ncbi:hypothetical protein GCM10009744_43880 [Kribbella alba]|uniref:Uncharacterized protein n=1 Tax=Kribbella alba TaxID=190197 RepID=A0ABN2FIT3_9ACTN